MKVVEITILMDVGKEPDADKLTTIVAGIKDSLVREFFTDCKIFSAKWTTSVRTENGN